MEQVKLPTAAEIRAAAEAAKRAVDFVLMRDAMRTIVEDVEKDADDVLGKREGKEFYEEDASFEPKLSKLVKSSDVIVALNLMAAHLIVRTWPSYLRVKIREWIVGKIAGASAALGGMAISVKAGAAALSKTIGVIVGLFTTKAVQEVEMRALEKSIRAASSKVRRELNEMAMAQVKKPAKVGPVFTRNG